MGRSLPSRAAALETRFPDLSIFTTTGPGHAAALARGLGAAGYRLAIAAGGDGTFGEVVDGLMAGGGPMPELALVPSGTGSDFARNLALPRDPQALARHIAETPARAVDCGRVTCTTAEGGVAVRHFLNIASLGLSAPTAAAVNAARKGGRAPGRLVFLRHTLSALMRYAFDRVEIAVDDQPAVTRRIAVVAVANGTAFGGGMKIAPGARLDDGLFELVIFEGTTRARLMSAMASIYRGAHVARADVRVMPARVVTVRPAPGAAPALVELDGEQTGQLPARFEILPGALRLRA